MSLKWQIWKLKKKFIKKNFTTDDLKCGTIVETINGVATIIHVGVALTQTIYSADDELDMKPVRSYTLNTHNLFCDEHDHIVEEDILRVVGFDSDWRSLIGSCPNPNGEFGKCYTFDKFGDRSGCLGCIYAETLPNGVFDLGDPLPGLTKMLNEGTLKDKLLSEDKEDD